MTEAEFAFLMRRAGLRLEAFPVAELHAAFAHIEAMADRVRRPLGSAAKPVDHLSPAGPPTE